MNYITLLKGLFSNCTSPTAAQWQAIRNDALKLVAVATALLFAAKSGSLAMSAGFQNVLHYVVVIGTASAAQSQTAINNTTPPANDGTTTS